MIPRPSGTLIRCKPRHGVAEDLGTFDSVENSVGGINPPTQNERGAELDIGQKTEEPTYTRHRQGFDHDIVVRKSPMLDNQVYGALKHLLGSFSLTGLPFLIAAARIDRLRYGTISVPRKWLQL
jgi:hypothetical protein